MQVRITDNFTANLREIEIFLETADAGAAYDTLLDHLQQAIVPNLENHPRLGKLLLQRTAHSVEVQHKQKLLATQHSDLEVREYISGNYLLLYSIHEDVIYLLSIKHHKQLSFDLLGFWPNQ